MCCRTQAGSTETRSWWEEAVGDTIQAWTILCPEPQPLKVVQLKIHTKYQSIFAVLKNCMGFNTFFFFFFFFGFYKICTHAQQQAGHMQLHVKFPVFSLSLQLFPCVFLHKKMNNFYFLNSLYHLLNHKLNLKLFIFPALSKFPVFS